MMKKILFFIIGIVFCLSSFATDTRSTALDLSPAKWIWYPAGRTLQNTFVLFRKDIILDKKPHKAIGWGMAGRRDHPTFRLSAGYWQTADIACLSTESESNGGQPLPILAGKRLIQ